MENMTIFVWVRETWALCWVSRTERKISSGRREKMEKGEKQNLWVVEFGSKPKLSPTTRPEPRPSGDCPPAHCFAIAPPATRVFRISASPTPSLSSPTPCLPAPGGRRHCRRLLPAAMVRLTADLIWKSPHFFNAIKERELDLRGSPTPSLPPSFPPPVRSRVMCSALRKLTLAPATTPSLQATRSPSSRISEPPRWAPPRLLPYFSSFVHAYM